MGKMTDRKSTRLNSSHTVIYTLSLHDALPISEALLELARRVTLAEELAEAGLAIRADAVFVDGEDDRSEEHTSELQSHRDLHSFPTRRSSDLRSAAGVGAACNAGGGTGGSRPGNTGRRSFRGWGR